jgi:predicted kinase
VVLDYGLWGRWERDAFRARAEAVGAQVELHVLDMPLTELWRRVNERNGRLTPSEPFITEQELAGWWAVFECPDDAELASYQPA